MSESKTAIVGIVCRDGVVVGTDSSATFSVGQIRTIEQPTDKLDIVADSIIVAGTGQVGLGQRFVRIIENAHAQNMLGASDPIEVGKALAQAMIADFMSTYLKPGQYGALVAFAVNGKPQLCEFACNDFQPEFKNDKLWYVSMGGGQLITDPFLALMRDVFWSDGPPNLQDGIFAATWALEHVIQVNAGGVGGPAKIAVLEKHGGAVFQARVLDDAELAEHRQNILEAKARLRGLRDQQKPTAEGIPDVPKPTADPVQPTIQLPAPEPLDGGAISPGLAVSPDLRDS